ncbi:MAG: biopolymer transporter ExbD [Marinilabiliaceae bacterium]|nr:biopolymer transporter ExbD [Marinilabiliaceae bacterium]
MALKTRNKLKSDFSMASMTDIVFLLLIFFMITSTLVNPNAIKLLLPQSTNQTAAKPITTVSITQDLKYFVETKRVDFDELEQTLQEKLGQEPDIYISLHVEENVPVKEMVKVMNIAKRNNYKMILATRPEK